jgi:hypothetical protein
MNNLLNSKNTLFLYGTYIFLASFIVSEMLLFYPALVLWFGVPGIIDFVSYLFYLSIGMLSGITLIFISSLNRSNLTNDLP